MIYGVFSMIVFRYRKTDGAEFISHLDTLRHLNKTFVRAGILVKKSAGFHPHPLVYMSSPIGVGLVSYAEYCSVDTDVSPDEFKKLFNEFSPRGIKCERAFYTVKNVNLAAVINRAEYEIFGVNEFEPQDVLGRKEFFITDKRGNEKEVRNKIYSIAKEKRDCPGGSGEAYLKVLIEAGNNALRPDCFAEKLVSLYGGSHVSIIKRKAFVAEEDVDDYLSEQE